VTDRDRSAVTIRHIAAWRIVTNSCPAYNLRVPATIAHVAGPTATDPEYPVAAVKTEFREALNTADVARFLAILDPELVDMSEGYATSFAVGAHESWRQRLQQMFAQFRVDLVVIIIAIRIFGDRAYDYGWHKLTLTPLAGGEPQVVRTRYTEIWRMRAEGWKLAHYADSREVAAG
jgi:ketosteroid isomerase-like protein